MFGLGQIWLDSLRIGLLLPSGRPFKACDKSCIWCSMSYVYVWYMFMYMYVYIYIDKIK